MPNPLTQSLWNHYHGVFSGKGVGQSFQKSYYWSTIALKKGVTYLTHMNQFALMKLNEEEKMSVEADLKHWSDHSVN
jgi:hypothetical protein